MNAHTFGRGDSPGARTAAPTPRRPLSVIGLGTMGTALARAWLAAGHPVTVWNRTPARAEPLAAEGATVADSVSEAVAADGLVVLCLLDDASVREALDDVDLTGKDLVNLTTGTPADARSQASWAAGRGARFLDGGIMAVPPMIGVPESGGYVLYSGDRELFEEHRDTLAVPAGTTYVGEDPGFAALHDVALLSAMTGMFAGVAHAFALVRRENVDPAEFAGLLVGWLTAMAPAAHQAAEELTTGDYTENVVSSLAMMATANTTLLRTAEEQRINPELITPYTALMERHVQDGHGDESATGLIDLLLH